MSAIVLTARKDHLHTYNLADIALYLSLYIMAANTNFSSEILNNAAVSGTKVIRQKVVSEKSNNPLSRAIAIAGSHSRPV